MNFSQMADEETEFIPLMSSEDEEQMNNEAVPQELPILPLQPFCFPEWSFPSPLDATNLFV